MTDSAREVDDRLLVGIAVFSGVECLSVGRIGSLGVIEEASQHSQYVVGNRAVRAVFVEYMKATNSRTSYKGFTTDNYDNDKPITAGLIRYDKESGIYYLECDINCSNNTLELSVADMASNGAEEASQHSQYVVGNRAVRAVFVDCITLYDKSVGVEIILADTSLDFDGLGSTPTEAAIAKSVAFDKSKIK